MTYATRSIRSDGRPAPDARRTRRRLGRWACRTIRGAAKARLPCSCSAIYLRDWDRPGRSRRPVGIVRSPTRRRPVRILSLRDENEGEDTQDAERGDAALMHDYGVASSLDPANRRLPSAVVTERAFELRAAIARPSPENRGGHVAALSEFRVQPCRISPFGLPTEGPIGLPCSSPPGDRHAHSCSTASGPRPAAVRYEISVTVR